jgi:hypothetical protein
MFRSLMRPLLIFSVRGCDNGNFSFFTNIAATNFSTLERGLDKIFVFNWYRGKFFPSLMQPKHFSFSSMSKDTAYLLCIYGHGIVGF